MTSEERTLMHPMMRPDWDTLYLAIAELMSTRSTCPRRQCGAAVVSYERQILASGYNGAIRGEPHCSDVGCRIEGGHCVRAVHAEANAIAQGARLGIALSGSTLYITDRPCVRCAGLIIQAGIAHVVYARDYSSDGLDAEVRALFESAGVLYRHTH